ncbi:hypothetical protein F4U94_03650 [Sphingobium limneticum]|nr:hypothetical protein F4U94_03650 [Sphingobium limneticum]
MRLRCGRLAEQGRRVAPRLRQLPVRRAAPARSGCFGRLGLQRPVPRPHPGSVPGWGPDWQAVWALPARAGRQSAWRPEQS